MIDCSITENYLVEHGRMCSLNCETCPMSKDNNGTGMECVDLMEKHPLKAIQIVQDWSNEHPQKTMKDKFFEIFPDAPKETIKNICPYQLGWEKDCENSECDKCWDRPYIEKECAE